MDTDNDNSRADHARRGSPFLNTAQAAHYIGLSPQTLEKMRREARGPRYRKHGRYVRYHIADLEVWSEVNGHDAALEQVSTGSRNSRVAKP